MKSITSGPEFSGLLLVVLGDVMLDRSISGRVERVSPESQVPVLIQETEELTPGGAANVARNIVNMGGSATVVGLIGPDQAGQSLVSALQKDGVETSRLITSSRPTTTKSRLIARGHQIARVDHEVTDPACGEELLKLIDAASAAIESADALIISDYRKGVATAELCAAAIGAATRAGIPVVVDPKTPDYSRFRGSSIVMPNRSEALEAAGLFPDGDPVRAGALLLEAGNSVAVLITAGQEGMILFELNVEPRFLPARTRKVFDVTGAGDVSAAAMGLSLAAGLSHAEGANLANLAAGLAVEKPLTSTVSAGELARERLLGRTQ